MFSMDPVCLSVCLGFAFFSSFLFSFLFFSHVGNNKAHNANSETFNRGVGHFMFVSVVCNL